MATIDTGSTVTAMIGTDVITLTLDDRVFPDASAGQYEPGWWAFNVADETDEYFVNTDGDVYGRDDQHNYTKRVGSCFEIKPTVEVE